MTDLKIIKNSLDHGEVGDALLLAELHNDVVYDTQQGQWYIFNGVVWERDTNGKIRRLITRELPEQYLKLIGEDQEANGKIYSRCRLITKKWRIKNIEELARDYMYKPDFAQWDTIPHKLACQNGVLNLKTGKLEAGTPSDFLSYQIPVDFDETAQAPRFEQFLQEVFDSDREVIDFIQILFGYGMLGSSHERKLVIFSGEGSNGKDTLLTTIGKTLGPICDAVSCDVLVDTKNITNTTTAAQQLENLHIAYTSESARDAFLNSERVKHLTGNNPIPVKKLYQDVYTITPKHLLLLLTNHKPNADAIDTALWDRLILVEFGQRFVSEPEKDNEHPIDPYLTAKLTKEAPGILNWLVQGAVKYHDYGLQVPYKLKVTTEQYREQNDDVSNFISNYCTLDDGLQTLAQDLYSEFCSVYDTKIKYRGFNSILRLMGFEEKRLTEGKAFLGIAPIKAIELQKPTEKTQPETTEDLLKEVLGK